MHTLYCSSCGKLDAYTIAKQYAEAGYSGITVTDHYIYNSWGKQWWPADPKVFKLDMFLEGYYRVREAAAAYGITVYKGAEIRFAGSPNDYLVYNCPQALLADPEGIFEMGLAVFHDRCVEAGALLVQAHPFRGQCTPAEPQNLDGVEVRNMHPRHDSRNDLALAFAQEHKLLQLSGSDCHQFPDIARGGIMTEVLPANEAELVQLLRSGNYQMI